MDLRRFQKATEELPSSISTESLLPNLGCGEDYCALSDRSRESTLSFLRTQENGTGSSIPSVSSDSTGIIWPNKQVWQYMTLPFTITLALQNLSPSQENPSELPPKSNKILEAPNKHAATSNSLEEIMNLSKRITQFSTRIALDAEELKRHSNSKESVIPYTIDPPPKQICTLPKKGCCLDERKADFSLISLPKSSKQGLRFAKVDSPNTSEHFYIPNKSNILKRNTCLNHSFRTEARKLHKTLPYKSSEKYFSSKKKAISYGNDEESTKKSAEIIPDTLYNSSSELRSTIYRLNRKRASSDVPISCAKLENKVSFSSPQVNKLKRPKLKTTKEILHASSKSAKPIKKVRSSEDVSIGNASELNTAMDIPRIVFPIYNKTPKPNKYSLDHRHYSVSLKTKDDEQESWSIIEKMEPNEKEQMIVTLPLLPEKTESSWGYVDCINHVDSPDLWLFDDAAHSTQFFKNTQPQFRLKTSKKKIPTDVELPFQASECTSKNSLLPSSYQNDLLKQLSKERIMKAYNLHETLLEKLGGAGSMPERRLEIDLFRRDFILELIRKQFEVANVDELRDAIMKYLRDQEKVKSYVDIIENVTRGKKEQA